MLVHCVRHGLTAANLSGRFNGWRDDPLLDSQRESLRELGFDCRRYDVVYASPLRRAAETAECLGIAEWIPEPRIAERNLGIFEGLTPQECEKRFPAEYAAFLAFDADYEIPNGESRGQNLARVLGWVESLEGVDQVLAVTHGGTIDFLYRLASRIPVHGGSRIYAGDNATVSIFEVGWPEIRLVDYCAPLDARPEP